jgi:hypothetical protein
LKKSKLSRVVPLEVEVAAASFQNSEVDWVSVMHLAFKKKRRKIIQLVSLI